VQAGASKPSVDSARRKPQARSSPVVRTLCSRAARRATWCSGRWLARSSRIPGI